MFGDTYEIQLTTARRPSWWRGRQILRQLCVPHTPILRVWFRVNFMLDVSDLRSRFANLLCLAKYRVVRVDEKSGSRAAALQIATSQYYAGLSSWTLGLDS